MLIPTTIFLTCFLFSSFRSFYTSFTVCFLRWLPSCLSWLPLGTSCLFILNHFCPSILCHSIYELVPFITSANVPPNLQYPLRCRADIFLDNAYDLFYTHQLSSSESTFLFVRYLLPVGLLSLTIFINLSSAISHMCSSHSFRLRTTRSPVSSMLQRVCIFWRRIWCLLRASTMFLSTICCFQTTFGSWPCEE